MSICIWQLEILDKETYENIGSMYFLTRKCLIDNTISFAEVAENYDVVGRRGDLWILEDKVDE